MYSGGDVYSILVGYTKRETNVKSPPHGKTAELLLLRCLRRGVAFLRINRDLSESPLLMFNILCHIALSLMLCELVEVEFYLSTPSILEYWEDKCKINPSLSNQIFVHFIALSLT